MMASETRTPGLEGPADAEVARRVRAGEPELFELLMRRHNQRVYRAIRSLVRDEAEVEDAMQAAYVSAYVHLGDFQGASSFSTWLVRIALNEALGRLRRGKRLVALEGGDPPPAEPAKSPEELVGNREIAGLLERAVDDLPDLYRATFVLREIEGMSTAEAAEALGTSEDVVKTRLRRARLTLQERLVAIAGGQLADAFPFHAPRCDRVVAAVMGRLAGRP